MFIVDAWNWLMDTAAEFSEVGVIIRLLFAMLVGIIVGIDREKKRRGAGIKTHTLVCLGAAIVMITTQFMIEELQYTTDASRLGAQVISGVGFLGVGTIIVTGKNKVRGLTTAASLWVCACLGLAAGIGYIEGVIFTLVFLVFALKILGYLDNVIHKHATSFELYLEFYDNKGLTKFLDKMKDTGITINVIQIGRGETDTDGPNAIVNIQMKKKDKDKFFDELREEKLISFVEEL